MGNHQILILQRLNLNVLIPFTTLEKQNICLLGIKLRFKKKNPEEQYELMQYYTIKFSYLGIL